MLSTHYSESSVNTVLHANYTLWDILRTHLTNAKYTPFQMLRTVKIA